MAALPCSAYKQVTRCLWRASMCRARHCSCVQLGWVCKALIVRDWTLLWVISVGFELMELTFQHMLPNFNECWWDSWILDVLVCNFAGMWGGMKVCQQSLCHQENADVIRGKWIAAWAAPPRHCRRMLTTY